MPPTSPPVRRLVEYLCPSGHVIVRLKEGLTYLGSPERRCRQCGRIAVVPQYCEWADMTGAQRQMAVRRAILGTIFAGSVTGVVLAGIAVVTSVLARRPEPEVLVLAGVAFLLGPAVLACFHVLRFRASLVRTRVLDASSHFGGG